jgi:hypothetical protein
MADFEWQRYIRPYFAASPAPGDDSVVAQDISTVVLQCLDQQVEYGFEYLGCASLPVFTPRANNYIIAFTQVSAAMNWPATFCVNFLARKDVTIHAVI